MPNFVHLPDLRDTVLAAQAGCQSSMTRLFDCYSQPLLAAIRARMTPKVRQTNDTIDFVQQTKLKVLLAHIEEKHFQNPQAFLGYLIPIARREVQQAKRKLHNQAKWSSGPDTSVDELSGEQLQCVVDRAPYPDEVEDVEERWRNVLAKLPLMYRRIAILLREEYTQVEIAAQLGINERTVRRAVKRIRETWKEGEKDEN